MPGEAVGRVRPFVHHEGAVFLTSGEARWHISPTTSASRAGSGPIATRSRPPNLRWLFTSGTPGLAEGRNLPPDIAGQADLAWQHILRMLDQAGMTVGDIVKVTQYLTRAEDVAAYVKVRSRFLADTRPAFMLLVVPQLVWPEILVEVEVIAAKA
jgi:2-iminobutanoate/2-iminopropanoate deaminase